MAAASDVFATSVVSDVFEGWTEVAEGGLEQGPGTALEGGASSLPSGTGAGSVEFFVVCDLLRYCFAENMDVGVVAFLSDCSTSFQWNEWQRVVYVFVRYYEEEFVGDLGILEFRSYVSILYTSSMKNIYGAGWRLLRRNIPGSNIFGP